MASVVGFVLIAAHHILRECPMLATTGMCDAHQLLKGIRRMLIEMRYNGLRLIISGGQNGADRGALEAASKMNCATGGHAPFGFRTMDGNDPSLANFGLIETPQTNYNTRTRLNVQNSDATLIVASDFNSPGTVLTIAECHKANKKYFKVDANKWYSCEDECSDTVVEWIKLNSIEILNVAGNRDVRTSRKHHDISFNLIEKILQKTVYIPQVA